MSKQRVFWICQVSGWLIVALINFFVQALKQDFNWLEDLIASFMFMGYGIIFTTLLRHANHRLADLVVRPLAIILPVLCLSLICAIAITAAGFITLELMAGLQQRTLDMFTFDNWLGNLIGIYPLVIIWSVIYWAVHYLMRWRQSELDKAHLANALKDAQLNTLMGQINPHFMFNSLNNIRALMLEDVERARDMLTRLSKVLRYSLTAPKKEFISLQQELEIVEAFLALAKIQLEDRLNVIREIDSGLEQSNIPPMLLQMLVENAIKHGISEVAGGGELVIHIARHENGLIIRVTNPGKLGQSQAMQQSTQLGTDNIRQRLALLYNGQASFELTQQGEQVVAEVNLPL